MAFTVVLALIGTTLACLNTGVRITYAMSKDKELPSIFGLLHGRFATPQWGHLGSRNRVSCVWCVWGA